MTGDGRRPRRVAEAIRERIADALSREVADPRLDSLVLTSVSVTDDLSLARIAVRLLIGDDDPARREAALRALHQGAGRLRRLVGPRLRLRRSPELRFEYDTGHDATRRVEELLDEIHAESPSSSDD